MANGHDREVLPLWDWKRGERTECSLYLSLIQFKWEHVNWNKKGFLFYLFIFKIFIFTLFYFTILYWFCHTLTWIHHGCTCNVLVFAVQRESGIRVHISPPFWREWWAGPCAAQLLPASCLCYTWECICVSATLSVCRTLSFPHCVHKSLLCVCVSTPALQVHQYYFLESIYVY